ncbi:MAG: hypothetical protein KAZ58_01155 [Arenimonas sp.]|jgi:hypothetical protein|nr:hypothetical protein [Arenimonas sp.]
MLKPLIAPIVAYFAKLRFPVLFGITVTLFVVNVLIPDFIPFADELILGLTAALLARWKKRKNPDLPAT